MSLINLTDNRYCKKVKIGQRISTIGRVSGVWIPCKASEGTWTRHSSHVRIVTNLSEGKEYIFTRATLVCPPIQCLDPCIHLCILHPFSHAVIIQSYSPGLPVCTPPNMMPWILESHRSLPTKRCSRFCTACTHHLISEMSSVPKSVSAKNDFWHYPRETLSNYKSININSHTLWQLPLQICLPSDILITSSDAYIYRNIYLFTTNLAMTSYIFMTLFN